jgi:hypothetical protein
VGAPGTDKAYIFYNGTGYDRNETNYVDTNSITLGVISNFDNAKSSSDGGAYATLREGLGPESSDDETVRPDGGGDENTWSSGGYLDVNDQNDATYLQSGIGSWEEALFSTNDHTTGSGIINWVRVYIRHQYLYNSDGTYPAVRTSIKSGTTESDGTAIACGASWSDAYTEYPTNPDTGSAWTWAEIDSIQIGVDGYGYDKPGPNDGYAQVSEVWLVVNYTPQTNQMDIEFKIDGVVEAKEYYLELRYNLSTNDEGIGVKVYNGATWDDLGLQGDLNYYSTTDMTTKEYTLSSTHRLADESVRVRFIGRTESTDPTNSSFHIDYCRVRSYVPPNTPEVTLTGDANTDFGFSVSSAGNVNQDSYDDVIIGAPGYNEKNGSAYLFYGASSMDNIPDVKIIGENTSDMAGYAVAGLGDVDNDGYADFAIGAPFADNGALVDCGGVYIFNGSSSLNPNMYVSDANRTMFGNQSGMLFGYALAGGDINLNDYSDVIVGAPFYDKGSAQDVGSVWIYTVETIGGVPPTNVVINEVMHYAITDPGGEWVELYNPGGDIDINGWDLIEHSGATWTIPSSYIFASGTYVTLANNGQTFYDTHGFYPDFEAAGGTIAIDLIVSGTFTLENDDCLRLRDASATVIDGLSWGTDTDVLNPPAEACTVAGRTLGRDKDSTDTDSASDWENTGGIDVTIEPFCTPEAQNYLIPEFQSIAAPVTIIIISFVAMRYIKRRGYKDSKR